MAQQNEDADFFEKIVVIIDKSFKKDITKDQVIKFLEKKNIKQEDIDKGFEEYYRQQVCRTYTFHCTIAIRIRILQ